MKFDRYLPPVALVLVAGFAAYIAVDWLWAQLDSAGRSALVIVISIALYAFGWCMDRIAGRSGKGRGGRAPGT